MCGIGAIKFVPYVWTTGVDDLSKLVSEEVADKLNPDAFTIGKANDELIWICSKRNEAILNILMASKKVM